MNKNRIDFTQEDLIEAAVREWVLDWCEKYHPEVFEKAREFNLAQLNRAANTPYTRGEKRSAKIKRVAMQLIKIVIEIEFVAEECETK